MAPSHRELLLQTQRVQAQREELAGSREIVGLTWSEQESERIHNSVDFGAQSAFAAPDRLVFAAFFWAPALC